MKSKAGVFLTILFMSTLASAFSPEDGLREGIDGVGRMVTAVFESTSKVIFDLNSVEEFLFVKIFLVLLLFMVINSVLKKNKILGDDKRLNAIIALGISILAIRYLPNKEYITAILLPYSALGIALLTFLPFVIFFFFIQQSNMGPFGRKAAWIVFIVAFLGIWYERIPELGNVNYIYMAGAGLAAIAVIYDKKIHEYFEMKTIKESRKIHNQERIDEARRKLVELKKSFDDGHYKGQEDKYKNMKKHYESIIHDALSD